jgi:O-antigen ligase
MDDESKSATYRLAMWIEGVEMIQQNPVFGIGKGKFLNYTGKLIAHNSSVEIMGETGLPGLIFWVGLLYMGIKNIFHYVRETEDENSRSYAMALGLSVAGYLISSVFVTLEYETLYFLVGLCAAVGFMLKEPPSFTERDFRFIGFISVGWVLALKGFLMVYVR